MPPQEPRDRQPGSMARRRVDSRASMTARRTILALVAASALLAACTTSASTSSVTTSGGSSSTDSPITSVPDPLVPFSPSPTPFVERTNGFLREAITLPTADGAAIRVTMESTAVKMAFTPENTRSLSVWLSIENAGDQPWTGTPGADVKIEDQNEGVWTAVAPTPADVHPDPERYGFSNRDLHRQVTVDPGKTVQGVLVFRPAGGNRAMTLSISFDGGSTWGSWVMNLGPF
jgi:hypothetical protein